MTRRGAVPWLVLAVWTAWIAAAQGILAARLGPKAYAPDLLLVFLLGLVARLPRGDLLAATLVVAAARSAFSVDPPAAVLVGYAAASRVQAALRAVVSVERWAMRTLVALVLAFALSAWWLLVLSVRGASGGDALALDLATAARTSLATAVAALLLEPVLVRLPGLGALWREGRR